MVGKNKSLTALRYFVIGVALLWSGIPILLIVSSSFKTTADIFAIPPKIFFDPTLNNYILLLEQFPSFFPRMLNSLIITAGATLITVVLSTVAGYVFSRYRSPFLTGSAFFLLFIRMLPPITITLPLFPIVNMLGMNDTHLLLILLYAAFFISLSAWIMKSFIDGVPVELEEAAVVDGAQLWQVISMVVVPLALSGMIASAIFVIIFSWNEFVFALIFTTRNAVTAPLVIAEILGTVEGVEWGILFAAATLQLLPILIFVVAVQRYIVAGLTAGAVKG